MTPPCTHIAQLLQIIRDHCFLVQGIVVCPFCDRKARVFADGRSAAADDHIGPKEKARRSTPVDQFTPWMKFVQAHLGLSTERLADMCAASVADINRWSTGGSYPTAPRRIQLINILVEAVKNKILLQWASKVETGYEVVPADDVQIGDHFVRVFSPGMEHNIDQYRTLLNGAPAEWGHATGILCHNIRSSPDDYLVTRRQYTDLHPTITHTVTGASRANKTAPELRRWVEFMINDLGMVAEDIASELHLLPKEIHQLVKEGTYTGAASSFVHAIDKCMWAVRHKLLAILATKIPDGYEQITHLDNLRAGQLSVDLPSHANMKVEHAASCLAVVKKGDASSIWTPILPADLHEIRRDWLGYMVVGKTQPATATTATTALATKPKTVKIDANYPEASFFQWVEMALRDDMAIDLVALLDTTPGKVVAWTRKQEAPEASMRGRYARRIALALTGAIRRRLMAAVPDAWKVLDAGDDVRPGDCFIMIPKWDAGPLAYHTFLNTKVEASKIEDKDLTAFSSPDKEYSYFILRQRSTPTTDQAPLPAVTE